MFFKKNKSNQDEAAEEKKYRKNKRQAIILFIIAVVMTALVAPSLYLRITQEDEIPMPFGFGLGIVVSGSMEPVYSVGDLIVIVPVEKEELEIGDVIVYYGDSFGGKMVVHRIKEMGVSCLLTKGDANEHPDPPISYDLVRGKVAFKVPFIGKLIGFMSEPIVFCIIIGACVVWLYLSLFKDIRIARAERMQLSGEIAAAKEETEETEEVKEVEDTETTEGKSEKDEVEK